MTRRKMRGVHTGSWDNVQDVLGFDLTAVLIAGEKKLEKARYTLFRYDVDVINAHDLPDDIVARFDFVGRILNYIAGSFNDEGMRKCVQLNNLRPVDILKGDWKPEDPES